MPRLRPGKSVADLYPEVALQWHPDNEFKSCDVSYGSSIEVMWHGCPVDSRHVWTAQVKTRTIQAQGCSVCRGTQVIAGVNDLATLRPDIAASWSPKNSLTASEVSVGSGKSFMWHHIVNGETHEWKSTVDRRNKGQGCSVCAGLTVQQGINDLATVRPEFTPEWSPANELGPHQVVEFSSYLAEWQCALGHTWKQKVFIRSNKKVGCPVCGRRVLESGFNDVKSIYPRLARQWDIDGNPAPANMTLASNGATKHHWVCDQGHHWRHTINERLRSTKVSDSGCPACSLGKHSSRPERAMRRMLSVSDEWTFSASPERLPLRWGRNNTTADVDALGRHETGIQLVVEYDGNYWHRTDERGDRDAVKMGAILRQGYLVARIREQSDKYQLEHYDKDDIEMFMVDVHARTWEEEMPDAVESILRWASGAAEILAQYGINGNASAIGDYGLSASERLAIVANAAPGTRILVHREVDGRGKS